MAQLEDKVAIVTGGASGIGEATVRRFHAEGARVAIADLNRDQAQSLADELGVGAIAIDLDVTAEPSWAEAVQTVFTELGGLHILINNVGSPGEDTTIEEIDVDEWDRVLRLNLTGTLLGCRYGIAAMRNTGDGGAIVNISSGITLKTRPDSMAYSIAKGGVVKLTQMVARRCGEQGYNIRVNAIYPGVVNTPAARRSFAKTGVLGGVTGAAIGSLHVLGRGGEPEELAAAILFLASDEASFVTGAALPVDGGFALL